MQEEEGSFTEVLEDKRLVTVHSLEQVGWRVVGVSYIGELLVSKQEIIIPLIILTLLALVVAFLISKRIASQTAKPIRELTEHMQEIELGKLGVEIDTQSDTEEIQCLTASFKEMVYKIEGLIEQVEDNQKKLRKSELKVS